MNSKDLRQELDVLGALIEAESDTVAKVKLIHKRLEIIEQLCENVEREDEKVPTR